MKRTTLSINMIGGNEKTEQILLTTNILFDTFCFLQMEILFKINEKIMITNPVFILKKVVNFLIDLKSCKLG